VNSFLAGNRCSLMAAHLWSTSEGLRRSPSLVLTEVALWQWRMVSGYCSQSPFSARCCARLGIPVSSIGPNPGSCLDQLHRYPAIATLIDTTP
jgi:hypothetical protein